VVIYFLRISFPCFIQAIGDVPLKPYITAEPDVVYHDLRNDTDTMFVVLASDGLFDVMSSEEVAHFVARYSLLSVVATSWMLWILVGCSMCAVFCFYI
jgi:serine/threonine protein phosphatase PrpC